MLRVAWVGISGEGCLGADRKIPLSLPEWNILAPRGTTCRVANTNASFLPIICVLDKTPGYDSELNTPMGLCITGQSHLTNTHSVIEYIRLSEPFDVVSSALLSFCDPSFVTGQIVCHRYVAFSFSHNTRLAVLHISVSSIEDHHANSSSIQAQQGGNILIKFRTRATPCRRRARTYIASSRPSYSVFRIKDGSLVALYPAIVAEIVCSTTCCTISGSLLFAALETGDRTAAEAPVFFFVSSFYFIF